MPLRTLLSPTVSNAQRLLHRPNRTFMDLDTLISDGDLEDAIFYERRVRADKLYGTMAAVRLGTSCCHSTCCSARPVASRRGLMTPLTNGRRIRGRPKAAQGETSGRPEELEPIHQKGQSERFRKHPAQSRRDRPCTSIRRIDRISSATNGSLDRILDSEAVRHQFWDAGLASICGRRTPRQLRWSLYR